jgi:hypothetical protein
MLEGQVGSWHPWGQRDAWWAGLLTLDNEL